MNETKLAEYIKRVVDSAPPLTAEQRDKLALLLRPSTAGERVYRRGLPSHAKRVYPRAHDSR
jgi:hypothetical protein